jgi:Protein of unknown function (DUF2959)
MRSGLLLHAAGRTITGTTPLLAPFKNSQNGTLNPKIALCNMKKLDFLKMAQRALRPASELTPRISNVYSMQLEMAATPTKQSPTKFLLCTSPYILSKPLRSPRRCRPARNAQSRGGDTIRAVTSLSRNARLFLALALTSALCISGCSSAYYSVMQKLGKEKRDILVQRVKDSKKDQEDTKEKLQTTMESFQALTGFQGGSLEKSYKKLNGDYESAADQVQKLHDRIQSIDKVSNDLFNEWQNEINEMGSAKLKAQSSGMLKDSKAKNAVFMAAMHNTETRITPVMAAFHDQVLFLKHNLNARAIGSLKGTSAKMDTDVTALKKSIDASMAEADNLINSLSATDKTDKQ